MEGSSSRVPPQEMASRRDLLKLVGAAATGAVASTLVLGGTALAGDQGGTQINGNALELGETNTATSETSLTRTSTQASAGLKVTYNTPDDVASDALRGETTWDDASKKAAGVAGSSVNGYGVFGDSVRGYSLFAGGVARMGMGEHLPSGPPTRSDANYGLGDLFRDSAGNMFVCVRAGSGVTGSFRKIAGPTSAGQCHILTTPLRAYDSRPNSLAQSATGADGLLTNGTDRAVSLELGRPGTAAVQTAVPRGSSGALVSITLAQTTGLGFVTIYSNDVPTWPGTSNINWFGDNQILACTTISAVDGSSRIKLRGGGPSTHVILDVLGYFA